MKTEQTMNIICDCKEQSPHLPFERDKGVGWQCLMCGRRHLFYLDRPKFGSRYDWWREAKGWITSVDCLIYAPFKDGEKMTCFEAARWRKQASYQNSRLKITTKAKPPKPPVKTRDTSAWLTASECWKAAQENRRRFFLRRAEAAGFGLALASFDFKNRLIQKLNLHDEIEALFAESSHLRGVRDAPAREIRRYQKL
jgi:hypothetical protein